MYQRMSFIFGRLCEIVSTAFSAYVSKVLERQFAYANSQEYIFCVRTS